MRECVFRGNLMLQNDVNPRLQAAWKADGRAGHFPFSGAQRVWKTEHCPQINPYGSEDCPYDRRDCTLAYYAAASKTFDAHPDSFVAFFRTVAKTSGLDRADNKPLARDRVRTSGHSQRKRDLRRGPEQGSVDDLADDSSVGRAGRPLPVEGSLGQVEGETREGVRRSSGLTRLGDLLGSHDIRSRLAPRGRDKGEESADNDGDPGVGLPGPHGGRTEGGPSVEHGPPTRDPRIHQESE